MFLYRFWFDSELLWENPKDVRPYHVQTPWYWFPDSDVADAMIKVKSVSAAVRQPLQVLPAIISLAPHLQAACLKPEVPGAAPSHC